MLQLCHCIIPEYLNKYRWHSLAWNPSAKRFIPAVDKEIHICSYLCRSGPFPACRQLATGVATLHWTTLQTSNCDTPACSNLCNQQTDRQLSDPDRTRWANCAAAATPRRNVVCAAPLLPHYANIGLFVLATTQFSQPVFLTLRMQGLFNQWMPLYTLHSTLLHSYTLHYTGIIALW